MEGLRGFYLLKFPGYRPTGRKEKGIKKSKYEDHMEIKIFNS